MKFIVFYLQFVISIEGLGMLFSSVAPVRRLRKYAATVRVFPIVVFVSKFWDRNMPILQRLSKKIGNKVF